MNNITLVTATFNDHTFTLNMLKSLASKVKDFPNVLILDNSTFNKFPNYENDFIKVFDNTNFKNTPDYHQASKNHCSSIDYIMYNVIDTKYMMLCDNDIIFKKDPFSLKSLMSNYSAIGEIGYDLIPPARLFPYFCIIDVEYCKSNNIHYFDENRCMAGNKRKDTGCSFYEDLLKNKSKIKNIRLSDYIVHLKGGTLREKSIKDFKSIS